MSSIIPIIKAGSSGGGAPAPTPDNNLLDRLESYWPLDEASGTTAFDSHGSNDGTTTGATINQTGVVGKAYNFDGSGDYIDFGEATELKFNRTDPLTVSCWFKANAINTGSHVLLSCRDSNHGWQLYRHGSSGSYRLYWLHARFVDVNTDKVLVASSSGYNTTDWYHFAVTCDGTGTAAGTTIYVNGVAVSDIDIVDTFTTDIPSYTPSVEIGSVGGSSSADGLIDEVGVWTRELTPEDIEDLYNSGNGLSYDNFQYENNYLSGLVSYYGLNETSGSTAYDSHGPNDGSIVGDVTVNQTGKIDKCYDFAGSNVPDGYVNVGDINALDGVGAITVSAWVKRDTTSVGDSAGDAIISKWQGGAAWLFMQSDNAGDTQFRVVKGSTYYIARADTVAYDTNWHHYVGRYDGSEVSIWVDGVKQSSPTAVSGTINSGGGLVQIGTYQRNNDWFDGFIDEVGLWNRALTDDEILRLYNTGSGVPYEDFTYSGEGLLNNLASLWQFEEDSGIFTDSHGTRDAATVSCNYEAGGKFGVAAEFVQADSDYVEISTWTGLGSVDRTLSVWIKTPPTQGEYNRCIVFSKDHTSADEPAFAVSLRNTDGRVSAGLRGSYTQGADTIPTNTWVHVVQTVDYSTRQYQLYVNGVYQGGGTGASGFIAANPHIQIGRYNSHYGQYGSLTIDQMAVWTNRILTAEEVEQLYNNGDGIPYEEFTS